jgi:N-acyl-D-aspartate/D-glutamate deacylase
MVGSIRLLPVLIPLAIVGHAAGVRAQTVAYDLLIRSGTVVDGTGAARFTADVAISGDRIVRVDRAGIAPEHARLVLDATGHVVAPGFIDQHGHTIPYIADYPLAEVWIRQGITTVVSSPHSGDQPWPIDEFRAKTKVPVNMGLFAGHSWTRRRVMGMADRAPTAAEMAEMKKLVEQSMQHGALGLSTGRASAPGRFAAVDEVVELAKVAARHGGIYASHGNEDVGAVDAVVELIRVAGEAGLPAQVNHHTIHGAAQWGATEKTLALIDEARGRGLDIKFDMFPYATLPVQSTSILPAWAIEGGREALARRLADAATRKKIESELRERFERMYIGGELSRLRFHTVPAEPRYAGRTLADLAKERGLPATVDTAVQLIVDLELKGGFTGSWDTIDEEDVRRLLRHPMAMIDTEDSPVGLGEGEDVHPRIYGSFPRFLGRYVRELKLLTLEEAIRRVTSLSADQIGQRDRGRVAEGMFADLVVFNPDTIAERGTFEDPHHFPAGIRHVIVNGVPALKGGAMTGEKPGRVLAGPARPPA